MLMYIFQGIVLSGMACTQEPLELVLSLKAVTAFQKRFDARHFSESGIFTLCVRCSLKLVGAISFVRFSSTIHEIFQQNTEKYQLYFYLLHMFCKIIVVPKVIFQNDANLRKEVIERQTRM